MPIESIEILASKDLPCLPNEFLSREISRKSNNGCSVLPITLSLALFASSTIPAHIPKTGIPDSTFCLISFKEPFTRDNCPMVVLSPQGMSRPSSSAISSGVFTIFTVAS